MGTYEYDPWGKVLSVKYAQGVSVGSNNDILNLNPFRYRGYYYDTETEFYYLNARYYDPQLKRFISADSVIAGISDAVTGYNLFAYCDNDPVNKTDRTGNTSEKNAIHTVWNLTFNVIMIAMITYFTGGFGAGPAALATVSGETVIQIGAAAVIYAEAVVIAKEAAKATISIASQMPKISFDTGEKHRDDNNGRNHSSNQRKLKYGSNAKSEIKLNNQIQKRGWTKDIIQNTVDNPYTTRASINKANGNSATVFYTKEGSYVIVDDITNEIVQISDNINPSLWSPDSEIVNPYMPWR